MMIGRTCHGGFGGGGRTAAVGWCLLAVAPVLAPTAASAADELSSQALTSRAWNALGSEQLDSVFEATTTCQKLYTDEAKRQQAALSDFLPAEKGHDAWALNDVGTCLFIEGQALEKAGRREEAASAYRKLIADYGFAQCWDEKGWFWKPAQAATERLKLFDFDALLAE